MPHDCKMPDWSYEENWEDYLEESGAWDSDEEDTLFIGLKEEFVNHREEAFELLMEVFTLTGCEFEDDFVTFKFGCSTVPGCWSASTYAGETTVKIPTYGKKNPSVFWEPAWESTRPWKVEMPLKMYAYLYERNNGRARMFQQEEDNKENEDWVYDLDECYHYTIEEDFTNQGLDTLSFSLEGDDFKKILCDIIQDWLSSAFKGNPEQ